MKKISASTNYNCYHYRIHFFDSEYRALQVSTQTTAPRRLIQKAGLNQNSFSNPQSVLVLSEHKRLMHFWEKTSNFVKAEKSRTWFHDLKERAEEKIIVSCRPAQSIPINVGYNLPPDSLDELDNGQKTQLCCHGTNQGSSMKNGSHSCEVF